ncbi:hypothetical protein J2B92_14005 [Lysinibacillus sphaericus]|uniref:hypothetical protein n=1 Tax=Lysinibacillus sphaericus TaxID=1421 RepID=UPI001A9D5726|nr:hypothetical protein [Lysinibacillus sphaericus]MBG9694249.1 hypothetical protein [Lysinibacillus sphaericus]MBG9756954.1 hypothetical protein [Lysinibacillus sphaericus]QTB12019.1 hypothetical protein J2B92_14005 [Lysinibacillus sphaericus]
MQENDITFVQEMTSQGWHHTYEGIIPHETSDFVIQIASVTDFNGSHWNIFIWQRLTYIFQP